MAIKVQTLYNKICTELVEEGGVQLGIVSQADIISHISQVAREWIYSTGIYRQLFIIPVRGGVSVYDQPSYSTGAQQAWFNNVTIFESSGYIWDQTDYSWRLADSGNPSEWREDNVGVLKLQLRPTPMFSGATIGTDINGFYGTISSTSNANRLDISLENPDVEPMYGVISSTADSSIFVDCPGGLFGIPASIEISTGNLMATTYNDQYYTITSLDDYIDVIPNTFEFYILAGVLARVYAADSELKNPEMAKYWGTRYKEGINVCRAVADEVSLEDKRSK